jgi:glycosyltransferase involved in cell wall biosynthesis
MVIWVLIDGLLLGGLIVLSLFLSHFQRVVRSAPVLEPVAERSRVPLPIDAQDTTALLSTSASDVLQLSVVIPMYNEAVNIADCLQAVQEGLAGISGIEVIVVDDQSTDATCAIAQAWATAHGSDPGFPVTVLAGQDRPTNTTWAGKNWACFQGAELAKGRMLLFLDADVRLKPGVAAAFQTMDRERLDLLTLIPEITCGCLAEWIVQPLVVSLLLSGFDFTEVNDPNSDAAFAAGHFMLFRRAAYDQLGGHRAVANQPVEDVELARLMKPAGLRLKFMAGREVASVWMYRSWGTLWEGWTKNWHLGSRRNFAVTRLSVVIMLLACAVPWLGGVVLLGHGLGTQTVTILDGVGGAIALWSIVLHYRLRQAIQSVVGIPLRYWWLTGVGGLVVSAIAVASIIKTETGWGWTWRGRSLTLPEQP